MREEADSAWAEKGALGVRAREARGSRNKIHPAQKILPGLRPRAVPGCVVGRTGGRPQQDRGWAATEQRRAERQTQKKLARGNQKRLRREESREYLLLDYDLIE